MSAVSVKSLSLPPPPAGTTLDATLTIPQAATKLGCSNTTIYKAITGERLPAYRQASGGDVVLLLVDVNAYAAQMRPNVRRKEGMSK